MKTRTPSQIRIFLQCKASVFIALLICDCDDNDNLGVCDAQHDDADDNSVHISTMTHVDHEYHYAFLECRFLLVLETWGPIFSSDVTLIWMIMNFSIMFSFIMCIFPQGKVRNM